MASAENSGSRRQSPAGWPSSGSGDVLADRFPVSSAAVPLSDSLRRISGVLLPPASADSTWVPSAIPRWLQGNAGTKGTALTAASSVDSLDRVVATDTPASRLGSDSGGVGPRAASPTRTFTALDLANTLMVSGGEARAATAPLPPISCSTAVDRASVSSASTSSFDGVSM